SGAPVRLSRLQEWQPKPVLAGTGDGVLVARIRMAHDAAGRVIPQDALDASCGFGGAVANDDLSGVLREANADSAAVVDRDPSGAGCAVEQRVEHRPIRDGVGAIAHPFRLAIW